MHFLKSLIGVITLLLLCQCSDSPTSSDEFIKFKDSNIKLTAFVDTPFTIQFQELLVAPSPRSASGLEWSLVGSGKPDWLEADFTEEKFTGTPSEADQGTFTFGIGARRGGAAAFTEIELTVRLPNLAPVWSQDPIRFPSVCTGVPFAINLFDFVADPDGDPIQITIPFPPFSGIILSSDGSLKFKAEEFHVGTHRLMIQASDGKISSQASALLTIDECNAS